MTDDREVFKVRREAGLQKRHEKRLESATYTAAEVKVLTEAALRLGRKEAGEEIADALEAQSRRHPEPVGGRWHCATCRLLGELAADVRGIGSQPSPDATSGRTDPGEASEQCSRCGGRGYVPDWTNWDDYLGEPKPKPCPDCARDIGKGDPTT